MTKKRKISYAELLGGQAAEQPGAGGRVPGAGELPVAGVPDESPVAATPAVPDEPSVPAASDASAEAPAEKPATKARRRKADRADSPLDLAQALNERKAFERRWAGEPTPEAPAPEEPVDIAASQAGPASGEPEPASTEPAWRARLRAAAAAALPTPPASDAVAAHDLAAEIASELGVTLPPEPAPSARAAMRGTIAMSAITGASMGDAVASATEALPFRDRARARIGRADLLLFRVGRELFASPLAGVEEAVELPAVASLPEMSSSMLGLFELRGRMIPIYSPSRALGVPLAEAPAAALVVRSGERRMALAVDDVEDVLELDLVDLRDAPGTEDPDGVLLGVVRRGRELVSIVDGESLVTACLTERASEPA